MAFDGRRPRRLERAAAGDVAAAAPGAAVDDAAGRLAAVGPAARSGLRTERAASVKIKWKIKCS